MSVLAAILATALAVGPRPGGAEPTPAGSPEQAPLSVRQRTLLLLRVLVYDRNLAARASQEVVVAVLFRPGDPASERERDEVLEALARLGDEVVVKGRSVRGAAVPFAGGPDLSQRLGALHPAAVWVGAALAPQAAEIARVTAARKVLSAAGDRTAIEGGLAVGIVPGARRAVILVNTAAARAEGADLDAALLGLAELVSGRK